MSEKTHYSRCPVCNSRWLLEVPKEWNKTHRFECHNLGCGKKFTTLEYIQKALEHYNNVINIENIFYICYYGVNNHE